MRNVTDAAYLDLLPGSLPDLSLYCLLLDLSQELLLLAGLILVAHAQVLDQLALLLYLVDLLVDQLLCNLQLGRHGILIIL